MARLSITGEAPFQVLARSFIVGPSAKGYTLAYSADGLNFTEHDKATPADENLIVNGVPKFAYFKLVGNASTVAVTY